MPITGRAPRLADELDFRYMLARDAATPADVLAFMSDRFVGEVIGPRQKVLEARRQIALAELSRPGLRGAALRLDVRAHAGERRRGRRVRAPQAGGAGARGRRAHRLAAGTGGALVVGRVLAGQANQDPPRRRRSRPSCRPCRTARRPRRAGPCDQIILALRGKGGDAWSSPGPARPGRRARWRAAADVVDQVRRRPGITRAEVARRLRLSSGSAAEITARLRELRLLTEAPAPAHRRGRPTGVLAAHPDGPLVLAVELRHQDWRCAAVGLDGQLGSVTAAAGTAATRSGARRDRRRRSARRGAATAGGSGWCRWPCPAPCAAGGWCRRRTLGWGPVELAGLTELPLLVGNDATLAGVAEARTGAAAGARTALHLIVEVGIGGALVVDGRAVDGRRRGGR